MVYSQERPHGPYSGADIPGADILGTLHGFYQRRQSLRSRRALGRQGAKSELLSKAT
jgi:hypothetical protein